MGMEPFASSAHFMQWDSYDTGQFVLILQGVDLPYFIHSSTDGLSLHVTSAPHMQSRVCLKKKKKNLSHHTSVSEFP